jgi:hypothetical protein
MKRLRWLFRVSSAATTKLRVHQFQRKMVFKILICSSGRSIYVRNILNTRNVPHTFNVKNTAHLMNELTDLPYDRSIKIASLDISNMYSNVRIKEMIATLEKLREINNIEDKIKQDILKITQVIVEQNYFRFQDTIYVQNLGLAMGAPTKALQWGPQLRPSFQKFIYST